MKDSEPEVGAWSAFKQDLQAFLDRHPAAKFGFLLLANFAIFSFSEAILPLSDQTSSYAGHVIHVAWRSVVFSLIFFFVFRRGSKEPN